MKRRKHLTEWDCQELSQSAEGSRSLTQPFNRWGESREVHKGLYPRSGTQRWSRGKPGAVYVNRSPDFKSMDPTHSRSTGNSHMQDTDAVDDALFSDYMNENAALFDGTDRLSFEPTFNKKRCFSSLESHSHGQQLEEDAVSNSSSFFEEEDDVELGHMLDSLPDSHYGLLGVTGENNQSSYLLSQFPDELLQHIFGFLPIVDLYLNVSLVCKQWKAIVDDKLFIPWKKLYHRYVAKDPEAVVEVRGILKGNGITEHHSRKILNLVRYFASLTHCRQMDFKKILDSFRCHHSFKSSERSAAARFPDLNDEEGTVNAWTVIGVLVLLAKKASDIQKLIRCLQRPSSPLRLIEVIELLYCLATLVFAMREEKVLITNRVHYRIFYSLYLFENSGSDNDMPPHIVARNKPSFKLTNEQRRIINHDIEPGHVVKIMAFAGTGKTSTLIKYAERRQDFRFLYVTFNKSIANHASRLFPGNVTCKTFHSLAYQETGKLYQQRSKLNPSSLTSYTVNFVLPEGQAGFVRAKLVVKTLETFFASAETTIDVDHVPTWCRDNRGERQLVSADQQQFAVREASDIWAKMQNLNENSQLAYKMTHDGYLKLWQLRRPNLSGYDAIMVDEAQDCTPSIMEVVLSQTCGKIFAGDPHQQIYTFRGAVNALCEVPHTHIFYLTQSFRFGAEIAYVGATILDVCKKIRNKTLVGGSQEGTVLGPSQTKVAILSRSNSGVFDQAVRVTEGESPSSIHIIGGPENFGLGKIYDIWILLQPESERQRRGLFIKDRFIATWKKKGFSQLKSYALSSEDRELEAKIAIVEKYNSKIPELVRRINDCNTPDTYSADYILGTVHKAKGMEFDTVEINDDFVKVHLPRHNMERIQIPVAETVEDEWNLLYVAVTRAKKHLIITKSIENILTMAGEYFLQAELTSEVLKDGPVLCALNHCRNPIPEQSELTMRKLPVTYSDKSVDEGGYICHTCVQQRVGPLTELLLSPEVLASMQNKLENIVLPRNVELLLQVI